LKKQVRLESLERLSALVRAQALLMDARGHVSDDSEGAALLSRAFVHVSDQWLEMAERIEDETGQDFGASRMRQIRKGK